jgi:hypothetical protein
LRSLLFNFLNNNPDFSISESTVKEIVLDSLAMGSGLTTTRLIARLRKELEQKATAFVASDKDRFPSVVAALEQMMPGGSLEQVRSIAVERLLKKQQQEAAVLNKISLRLAEFHDRPAGPLPITHATIHDAVAHLLQSVSISVEKAPDPSNPEAIVFVLPKFPRFSQEGTGQQSSEAMRQAQVSTIMNYVVDALTHAGYPTSWRYRDEGPQGPSR